MVMDLSIILISMILLCCYVNIHSYTPHHPFLPLTIIIITVVVVIIITSSLSLPLSSHCYCQILIFIIKIIIIILIIGITIVIFISIIIIVIISNYHFDSISIIINIGILLRIINNIHVLSIRNEAHETRLFSKQSKCFWDEKKAHTGWVSNRTYDRSPRSEVMVLA